ncbi:type II toxin-antitoxin system VapC family toxin [Bacteroidota bacterium]
MILVDSSVWLEFFAGSDYGLILKNNKDFKNNDYIVPTIVVAEVYKKLLSLFDEATAREYAAHLQHGLIVDLDFDISLSAALSGKEYKLPLADSIIYATTVRYNATLLTMDKHFKGLPNVKYFEKK